MGNAQSQVACTITQLSNTLAAISDFGDSNYGYVWWPQNWYAERDRTAKAMKIANVWMEERLVNLTTIEQFIDLVNGIMALL